MIVKMKKLTLICTIEQQKETLEKLQDLEVLHIDHINHPDSNEVKYSRQYLEKIEKARNILNPYSSEIEKQSKDSELVNKVIALNEEKDSLIERKKKLEEEIKRISIFGNFEPTDINKLRNNNVYIKLFRINKKDKIKYQENIKLITLISKKSDNFVVGLSKKEFSLPYDEIILPEKSLNQINEELNNIKNNIEVINNKLVDLASNQTSLDYINNQAIDQYSYEEAKSGMKINENVSFIQGYIPIDKEDEIKELSKKFGWGYKLTNISKDDLPPTLLRNPKWINPIKPIFDLIAVTPGYKELDVSAVFLIFLSIFFAFIIGDAGYGLLFLIATIFAKIKLKNKPSLKPAISLLIIMSMSTVVFGAITGNYFGIPLTKMPDGIKSIAIPFVTNNANNIMFICFSIGLIHLSIARIWNVIKKINSPSALIDFGWFLCSCSLYIFVLGLVINPSWSWFINIDIYKLFPLGAGILFVLIGLIATKTYIGLVTLFLDIISNFVDLVSYIRLYAVGTASLQIALAFNKIALGPDLNQFSFTAVLILIAGHTLNIILAVMGVMVHGIRLNTLEFSGHAGIEWAGKHYKPFSKISNN